MLTFIDHRQNEYGAQVAYKVTNSVNGERSVSGTIYTNDQVLHGIDRGWRFRLDDEYYVITFAKPRDSGNKIYVEFDAVHQFFWDFSKSAVHKSIGDGSHRWEEYLNFIFEGSGYSFENNVTVKAFRKESFGYKNRLSLFYDVIKKAGAEFVVYGRVVRILERVGSDLSTVVRKNFNMDDLKIEKNINGFFTFQKGFGAWKDDEDHSKGRLEVEYRSPLAAEYGVIEGEPVVDERYTRADEMKERLKKNVDNSYTISVQLDMEDLTNAGYRYDRPRAGDYIMAINDNLGFRERIRIVSYTSEFDVRGRLVSHKITCNDIGAVKRETSSAASVSAQIGQAQADAAEAMKQSMRALTSADGKNTVFYGSQFPKDEPTGTLIRGDVLFYENGEKTELYVWNGAEWEKQLLGVPEDFQRELDEIFKSYEQKIKEIDSVALENARKVADALTTAGASSDLAKTAKEISAKTKSDLDKLKNSAEEAQRSLGADIQRLDGSISSQAQDLNKAKEKLTTAEAELKKTKEQADKALAGLDGKVSTADFVQSQKEWTAKFSSVTVGGPNLIRNGDFRQGIVPWTTNGSDKAHLVKHGFYYNGEKDLIRLKNDGTTENLLYSNRFDLERDTDYTLNFRGFNNNRLKNYDVFVLGRRKGEDSAFTIVKQLVSSQKLSTTKSVDVSLTFNSGEMDNAYVRFDNNGAIDGQADLYIAEVDLYKGTTKRPWQPSPEDTDRLITAVQSEFQLRADGLDSQVKSLQEKDKATDTTITRLTQGLGDVTLGVERLTRNLETGLADKVTSTQLKVELDRIRTKVAETDAKTAKIAEVETTVNGVKETISKLNQGRRNLLKQSRTLALNENKRWNTAETYNGFTIARSTGGNQYTDTVQLRTSEPPKGTEYVLTFYARASKDNYPIRTHFYSPNTTLSVEASTGYKASKNPDGYANLTISREWKRYWVKYSQTEADEVKRVFIGRHGPVINGGDSTTTVEICAPALFEGNMIGDWSPAPEDGEAEITAAKAEFTRTADGLTQKLTAVESYVAKDDERSEALKSYVQKETASQIEAERSAVARDYVAKSNLTETVNNINRRFEQVGSQTDAKIAEYGKGVDGRFANITSQLNGKVNQTDFQNVQETSKLYERIIGSTEKDVTDKIARMVMTNQLFQVEVGKNSALRTVQRQLDNSWAVQNLTSAGQVVSHINLLGKNAGIKAETIRLEGTTLADKLSAYEGRFNKLFVADGTFSKLNAEIFAANSITADKLRITSALAEKMVADKAFVNSFFADKAVISQIQAIDLTANQIKSGNLKSLNGAMSIDLNNGQYNVFTENAALRRVVSGYPTQFIRFATGNANGKKQGVTIIGSNRGGNEGSDNGDFAGMRIWNAPSYVRMVDVVGDQINLASTAFSNSGGWVIRTNNGLEIFPKNKTEQRGSIIGAGDFKLYLNDSGSPFSLLKILKNLANSIGALYDYRKQRGEGHPAWNDQRNILGR